MGRPAKLRDATNTFDYFFKFARTCKTQTLQAMSLFSGTQQFYFWEMFEISKERYVRNIAKNRTENVYLLVLHRSRVELLCKLQGKLHV